MTKTFRRCMALALSIITLLSMSVPANVFAEGPAEGPPAAMSEAPTAEPTAAETAAPTGQSTEVATSEPVTAQTNEQPAELTGTATPEPTSELTVEPTDAPIAAPTSEQTVEPTDAPTAAPTDAFSTEPTGEPVATLAPEPSPTFDYSFSLDAEELTLSVGETRALTVLVDPADAPASFVWASSDEKVVIVDEAGLVTGVSAGSAVITATSAETGLTAQCAVFVLQPLSSLVLNGQARIQIGSMHPLTALDGETAVDASALIWSSSDEAVATVDAAGAVTGVSVGQAVITAAARDGSGLFADFAVEVLRATTYIHTKSNKQFAVTVSENNEEAESTVSSRTRLARAGSAKFALMRLIIKTDGTEPDVGEYNPDVVIANSDNRYLIQFTTAEETEAAYAALSKAGYVKFVEPDSMDSLASSGTYTYNSWGAEVLKADTANEDLSAQTTASLKVAVIDGGVSPNSFLGNKLINGYDFVSHDADPADENGHGTHVAGTIVDLTQSLNVYVVAYRAFDASGSGYTSNITNAIMVAADEGCKVINLSARGVYSSTSYALYSNAVNYAVSKGATFCCAAGNDGASTSSYVPASLTIPGCIVVGSVGKSLTHSSFSNTGSSVDVSAPGESILSCALGGGFILMTGTSMATPHISAACAIIKLAHPGYSPAQVENALKGMCLDLGPTGNDSTYGSGIPDLSALVLSEPTDVHISPSSASLALGTGIQLTATVSPSTADSTVTWATSDAAVATVSATGYVTAVAPGSTQITATTVNQLVGSFDLIVLYDPATSVTVAAPETDILVGNSMQLTATVLPATADQAVTWSSSDGSSLSVSNSGMVTAYEPCTARITATAANGTSGYVDVTVLRASGDFVVGTPRTSTPVGVSFQLYPQIPLSVANETRAWSSSKPAVMTVDANGIVNPISPGNVRITLTVGGLIGFVDLVVTDVVPTSITITSPASGIVLKQGNLAILRATVLPADANPTVEWSVSDPAVLDLKPWSEVWPVGLGTASITAKTVNGLTATVQVTVVLSDPSSITVTAPKATMKVGEVLNLIASPSPLGSNPAVTWTSSDAKVATVSADGKVTGVGHGSVRITGTTVNQLTASVDLYVGPRMAEAEITIGKREKWQLSVEDNVGAITWTSNDPAIATVSAAGEVLGVKVGTTYVTASVDGETFQFTVHVSKPMLSAAAATLTVNTKMTLYVDYSVKSVKWSSSRSSVASVSSTGKITARRPGTAVITATVDGYKLKCTVTVKANAHSYKVNMRAADYGYGASMALNKVYYSGSSIYLTSYLVNNYSRTTIYKIKSLTLYVFDEESGTLLAQKKFTNIYVNLKPGKLKKLTFRFTGSATKKKNYELRLRTQMVYADGTLTLK